MPRADRITFCLLLSLLAFVGGVILSTPILASLVSFDVVERRVRGLFLIVGACLVCWYGFNYIVLRKRFLAFILFVIYFFAMGFGLLNVFGRPVTDLWALLR